MSVLFTPKKIGEMEIQNRFVHSATYECMADDNGEVTEKLLKRYRRIVKGGVGLAELPINGLEVSCGTISYSMFNMVRGDVPTEEIISNFPLWRKIVGKMMLKKMGGHFEHVTQDLCLSFANGSFSIHDFCNDSA